MPHHSCFCCAPVGNLGQADDSFEAQRKDLADLDPEGFSEVTVNEKAMYLFIPTLQSISWC